jgi:hypothetical protein
MGNPAGGWLRTRSESLPVFSMIAGRQCIPVCTFWYKEFESCALQVFSGFGKADSGY